MWAFVESSSGPILQPSAGATAHHAPCAVLVQDYPEGGAHCLDIERFTHALYMRHMRRLVDPVEQGWKGMAMHWLEQHYGELRQGYRLLLSAFRLRRHNHLARCASTSLTEEGDLEASLHTGLESSLTSRTKVDLVLTSAMEENPIAIDFTVSCPLLPTL